MINGEARSNCVSSTASPRKESPLGLMVYHGMAINDGDMMGI